MDEVKNISYFFNLSEPRQKVLKETIEEGLTEVEDAGRRSKLVDVCRTRWVERILGLDIFEYMLPSLLITFHKMTLKSDETSSKVL